MRAIKSWAGRYLLSSFFLLLTGILSGQILNNSSLIPERILINNERYIAFTEDKQEPVLLEGVKRCINYRDAALLSRDMVQTLEDSIASMKPRNLEIKSLVFQEIKSGEQWRDSAEEWNKQYLKTKRGKAAQGTLSLITIAGLLLLVATK